VHTYALAGGTNKWSERLIGYEEVPAVSTQATRKQFSELLRAMRAGVAYANVHSTLFPGGEIWARLDDNNQGH
jgi:hypothetical protein